MDEVERPTRVDIGLDQDRRACSICRTLCRSALARLGVNHDGGMTGFLFINIWGQCLT